MELPERRESRGGSEILSQLNISSAVQHPHLVSNEVERTILMASQNNSIRMEGQSKSSTETPGRAVVHKTDICRQPSKHNNTTDSHQQSSSNVRGGSQQQCNPENRHILEQLGKSESNFETLPESSCRNEEVSVCSTDIISRKEFGQCSIEASPLHTRNSSHIKVLERPNTPSTNSARNKSQLVLATFNCYKWKSDIVSKLIEDFSENHSKSIVLALQETWLYAIPKTFCKKFEELYYIEHEPAMISNAPRKKGRPFGGIAYIISRAVPFKIKYRNSRCFSILLTNENVLLSNVYLPIYDRRFTAEINRQRLMEALGHFDAAHECSEETSDFIDMGDFNFYHNDMGERANLIRASLTTKSYNTNSDLHFLPDSSYTHKDGYIIDRIMHSTGLNDSFESVKVILQHLDSDHFPLTAIFNVKHEVINNTPVKTPYLCWHKASDKALLSFSNLCNKMCSKSLNKYKHSVINGVDLYNEVVNNITEAAIMCIPKTDPNKQPKRHNIPQWREKMSTFQNEVDYWTTMTQLHGGPRRCPSFIKLQLRLAKSAYRRQIRQLRRELQVNIAQSTTVRNCHKHLFGKTKHPHPH